MKFNTLLISYITVLMLLCTQSQKASQAMPRHQEINKAQQLNQVSGSDSGQNFDSDSEQDCDSDSESANHSVVSLNIDSKIMQGLVNGLDNVNKGINESKQQISNGMTQINQNIAALNPDHFFEKITSAAICTIAFLAGLYFSYQDRKIRAPLIATLPKMGLPELLRYYWHYEIFCLRNLLYYLAYCAYSDMRKPATVLAPALAQPPVIQGAPQARRH